MLILRSIVVIFLLCLVLYKASEILIAAIKEIADDGLIGKFFLAGVFTGVATSVPEIFVGTISALENKPKLSFGNAIGSNIVDLGLVFSLAVLFAPAILKIRKDNFTLKTGFFILTSSLFPFLLALDGKLSRVDGFFLLALFFVYSVYIFNKRGEGRGSGIFSFLRRLETSLEKRDTQKALFLLIVSLLALMVGSHYLIKNSLFLAEILSVSPFLIAVFIIAPGTSLPELFVALASLQKKEVEVLYGDIFGSLITNANLVVGLASIIAPFKIEVFPEYFLSLLALLVVFILFVLFSLTKHKFERWEASFLILVYFLFFLLESLI